MTTTLVREKLGQPLYVQYHADGELWFYTLDGKCRWGDWAWLCRQVEIREGRVVKVIKQVLYN